MDEFLIIPEAVPSYGLLLFPDFFFTIFIFSFKLFTLYFPINTICFRRPKANKACSGMKAITSTCVFTGSASQSLMSEEWVVGLLWYVLQ